MDNAKLTTVPTEKDKLHADVEVLRRALPIYLTLASEIAALRKAMFDAHIKAGFTADQAIILCQKVTL